MAKLFESVPCTACQGKGEVWIDPAAKRKCPRCNGSGRKAAVIDLANDRPVNKEPKS